MLKVNFHFTDKCSSVLAFCRECFRKALRAIAIYKRLSNRVKSKIVKLTKCFRKATKLKDDVFSVNDTGILRKKKNPSAPNRSPTYNLPITSSDALPLSYRRLVVARPLN